MGKVDGNSTTFEWQDHSGKVCVWAVASSEQHSVHLPLACDTIEAEYFADYIAGELDAARFPTMPFGTSLEMTAFRGTLAIKPELLMQIVRNVVDEAERQEFSIMVLLNGHGGNYCLGPVVRDINRMNRSIKIVLTNFWGFCDPSLYPDDSEGPNFHSAEWETSLMLALRPDLVREERADIKRPKQESYPLQQEDLNTFGIGHFNPKGTVGTPSLATAEHGEKIIASTKERIIPYIRDRIARLEKDWKY